LNTYTLKITEIRKETEDTHTICFKQPGLKKIHYLPGQYITLIVNINGRKYRRPYSFSSSPGIDATLNITVKRLPHGIVSNHLTDIVKTGDMIEVMGPMGEFVYPLENSPQGPLFLWGAGSGITPLMSILKSTLRLQKKVTLVYGNRKSSQTIFYDQLLKLKEEYPEHFSLFNFFTKEETLETNPTFMSGRIDEVHIAEIVNKTTGLNHSLHYICGPIELKKTVKNTLLHAGVKPEQVHSEDFDHPLDENELKDIQTAFVDLISNGNTIKLEVIRGNSILEAGLDHAIDLSYSCQTGTCMLCKATLLSGSVKTIGIENFPEGLESNECLLCCSYPLTDDVKVEVK
jgi:ring-1,2-phenylacetyl-CoA epoxidase subunit PaaE